jgi:hypothetical protein
MIELLKEQIQNVKNAWGELPAIERRLYELGRQHGERARRSEGAYRFVEDMLQAKITAGP